MSAADEAYEAARAEIARVKATGGTELDFDEEAFRALDRLPPEIAEVEGLNILKLDNTQVSNIALLQDLRGLTTLSLKKTLVSDIEPLRNIEGLLNLDLDDTLVSNISPMKNLTRLEFVLLKNTGVSDVATLRWCSNLRMLTIVGTSVSDIAPLRGLTDLEVLLMSGSQVADIAPLEALTKLETLSFSQTPATDLAPLTSLINLQTLFLADTRVADIEPLQGLQNLQELHIEWTKVADLRPLLSISAFRNAIKPKTSDFGLFFSGSDAAMNDRVLHALSEIEDAHDRTLKTLDYLATLPEWPAPLQKKNADPPRSDLLGDPKDPDIPSSVPAPLQVVEIDGMLRPSMPGDSLDADGHLLARQGWEALRDYLSDLADQRARLGNNMPRLGKALARLDVSLGETYEAINPVAVGTQGNRVIRLARNAPDMLLEEDADDIAEFAAALALFLERFPDWRAYREAARAHPPDPEAVQSSLPEIEAFAEALEEITAISPEIPDSLEQQAEAVREDPEDEIAAAGIVASLRNVASALGHFALSAWRIAKREGADIGKQTWGMTKKRVAATAATGLSGLLVAACDFYFNNAKLLQSLSAKFPEQLDWLARLLQAMGL